ncbi:hypothetical protein [Lysinibacillus sp. FSL K6-0102]|uniref:hypothetical protein n=1 Tax=Lysinibacillus sp. FSL K6-0102 TaxID=2975290 RepID=UPI0030FA9126
MWTPEVLEGIKNKTIKEAIPHYVGDDIYLIEIQFTDGTTIEIDNEYRQEKVLQARIK